MNKSKGILLFIIMLILSLITGCSSKENDTIEEKAKSGVLESTNKELSKEDYLTYIDNKYKEYLNDLDVDTKYSIDKVNVTAEGYINDLKGAYKDLENKLVSFKSDLVEGVKTTDENVKVLNDDLINSVDAAINEVKGFRTDLEDKSKELVGKSENEVKATLMDMESATKSARTKIATLISNAKANLGIE